MSLASVSENTGDLLPLEIAVPLFSPVSNLLSQTYSLEDDPKINFLPLTIQEHSSIPGQSWKFPFLSPEWDS